MEFHNKQEVAQEIANQIVGAIQDCAYIVKVNVPFTVEWYDGTTSEHVAVYKTPRTKCDGNHHVVDLNSDGHCIDCGYAVF